MLCHAVISIVKGKPAYDPEASKDNAQDKKHTLISLRVILRQLHIIYKDKKKPDQKKKPIIASVILWRKVLQQAVVRNQSTCKDYKYLLIR